MCAQQIRVSGLHVKPLLRRDCMARWHKFVELERAKPRLTPGHQVPRAALDSVWQGFARRFAAATDTEELVRFGLETDHLRGEIPWPFARQVVESLRADQDVAALARADGRAVRLVLQLLYQAGQGWRAQLAAMWHGQRSQLIGE